MRNIRVLDSSIWGTLELAKSLAKTNFKLRNEGSYLGVLWYLLEPLLMFAILLSIFSNKLGNGIEQYPLYLLLGLIMFGFFSQTTTMSTNAMVSRAGFITSMRIQHESLVLAIIFQSILSHFFEMLVFAAILFYYTHSIVGILYYPVIVSIMVVFMTGISFILASVGVYVRDLANLWRVVMRVLWFATPIFYKVSDPKLMLLNPMYHFIDLARQTIIYNSLPQPLHVLAILAISPATFIVGLFVFTRVKHNFAEKL